MTVGATSQDLAVALKAVVLLMDYPDEALRAHARELEGLLAARPELDADDRRALAECAAWLADSDLLETQAAFVETFDRSKKVSLYLFEHVYGESRDRGSAMIELSNAYREHGLTIDRRELPDYLPMFLEFTALLPEAEARAWLGDIAHILQRIHVRLVERDSRHAAPFRVLLRLLGVDPMPEVLSRMASEEQRDDTPAALDRAWMEAPVTFGPDRLTTGCGATRQDLPEQSAGKPVRWMDYRGRA